MNNAFIKKLSTKSKILRKEILDIVFNSNGGHIGGSYSILDVLYYLYNYHIDINPKKPFDPKRDYLIYSKGHCCLALYTVLSDRGFFNKKELKNYSKNNGKVGGHPKRFDLPGIEASTGSLGHGLSIANGIAHGLLKKDFKNKVYVILGDGELNEGSVWEGLLYASQHNLHNLNIIIDNNNQISLDKLDNILSIEPIYKRLKTFKFNVYSFDGHNYEEIINNFESSKKNKKNKANIFISNSIKGKGISFMEGNFQWHYRGPNKEEYLKALSELDFKK